MSACPEKIKIIRKPEYCLPNEQDIGKALFDEIGGEMPYFWIYSDPEYQSSECSNFIGESLVAGTLSVDLTSGAVHEVGHTAGLWDQYCYFPDDNNPNIADFEEASCFVADDEWNQWYCGREDLGSSAETAYECEGNFNASGGRTIMGLGGYSLGYNLIGFTEEELEYLAESLNCY